MAVSLINSPLFIQSNRYFLVLPQTATDTQTVEIVLSTPFKRIRDSSVDDENSQSSLKEEELTFTRSFASKSWAELAEEDDDDELEDGEIVSMEVSRTLGSCDPPRRNSNLIEVKLTHHTQ